MDETRPDPLPASDGAGDTTLESLAAEYVQNRLSGQSADVDRYLDRLPDDDAKTRFIQLVEGAEVVDQLLPRQVREGTVLGGRYRIVSELGAGGMGKVFVAWDTTLKREVAVKVLAQFDTATVDAGSMFQRESELLATLQHPGIVSIHETATEGDVRYIVMDLVRGRPLRDVLARLREARGDEPPPRVGAAWREAIDLPMPDGGRDLIGDDGFCRVAARIGAELARTIEAAHGEGVVHRDLKPGNVMLRGDGTPIVLDFGLAGRFDGAAGELTSGLFGSPSYIAPEQAISERTGNDPSSDLYQLGLILYEMTALQRAFEGDDVSSVLSDIGTGRFVAPRRRNRTIPVELEAITLKAMELDPGRRYATATELREDLERFLTGEEAPRAMGGGLVSIALRDARYFARRNRRPLQVAAALLVGAVLALNLRPAEVVEVAGGLKDVRWFTMPLDGSALDFAAASVRPDEMIGVEVEVDGPRWVYAYGLFGPEDDPHGFVAPLRMLTPEEYADDVRVDELEREIEAGRSDFLCSVADGASAFEGVVFFALEEPHRELEWWLEEMYRARPGEGGVHRLSEALALLQDASVSRVFPTTRGKSVWQHLSRQDRQEIVRRMKSHGERIDFEYPFDDLAQHRFVRFPVAPPP